MSSNLLRLNPSNTEFITIGLPAQIQKIGYLTLEPCANINMLAAARRSNLVGGGAPPVPKKVGGDGAAWAAKFSNFAYLFQTFFSKELLLSRYAC